MSKINNEIWKCGKFFLTDVSHVILVIKLVVKSSVYCVYTINITRIEDDCDKPSELKSFSIHRPSIDPV